MPTWRSPAATCPAPRAYYHHSLSITPIASFARFSLWHGLTGLARVAGKAGDLTRAARIFGMTAQLYDGYPHPYLYVTRYGQRRYLADVEATRAALGEQAFATAFAAGKALPLERAVAEVIAMPIPESPG